jgi:hypothetical protein
LCASKIEEIDGIKKGKRRKRGQSRQLAQFGSSFVQIFLCVMYENIDVVAHFFVFTILLNRSFIFCFADLQIEGQKETAKRKREMEKNTLSYINVNLLNELYYAISLNQSINN